MGCCALIDNQTTPETIKLIAAAAMAIAASSHCAPVIFLPTIILASLPISRFQSPASPQGCAAPAALGSGTLTRLANISPSTLVTEKLLTSSNQTGPARCNAVQDQS
jgi:hypothetical protein